MATKDADNKITILLNEYSACQSSVQSLEASVWQTAAIIGLISVGTFALVASNSPPISVAVLVALFSTIGAIIWWKLANRWWSVLHAKIDRMRHIEEDLKTPGQSHYIDFMDDLQDRRRSEPATSEESIVSDLSKQHGIPIERARALAKLDYARTGPKDILRYFPWATAIVWALYLSLRIGSSMWKVIDLYFFVFPFGGWWFFDA